MLNLLLILLGTNAMAAPSSGYDFKKDYFINKQKLCNSVLPNATAEIQKRLADLKEKLNCPK